MASDIVNEVVASVDVEDLQTLLSDLQTKVFDKETALSDAKASVEVLLKQSKATFETMDQLEEWDSLSEILANISTVSDYLVAVICAVEAVITSTKSFQETLSSEDKLEIAVSIVDDAIDLPWYAESFDGPVIRFLISNSVSLLNKALGKDWDLSRILEYLAKGKSVLA